MLKKYSQKLLDDLFEEGDRDHHFFNEFLGFVGNIYPEKFMKNRITLNKDGNKIFEDALLLASFFIASDVYVGFIMKEYGKPDIIFNTAKEFTEFMKKSVANDVNYLEKISAEDRYTVGLMKIKPGAKAPPATPEIDKIFLHHNA